MGGAMEIPMALIGCLAAGSASAVTLAVLWVRQQRRHRRRDLELRRRVTQSDTEVAALCGRLAEADRRARLTVAELTHLAEARLPALAQSLRHAHVRVPGPLHPEVLDESAGKAFDAVMGSVTAAVLRERRRVDGAAQAAMRGATTKLQTMCYQMQTGVDEMLHQYDDPDLAERLSALDYLNEQILRRLQVTRVVCGAGAGLVRTKSPLRALVMGASSRIPSYERVQIVDHLPRPVAVVDRASEPLAIVVAELLANAVHHSHGSLPVEVTLHQAHNGAVVVINDAGIGMNADEFGRARRLLSGTEVIHLGELGDPPRSGFAAIGELCRQFGMAVSVEPSHYGGVKAVVFLPGELLTPTEEEPPIPAPVPAPVSRTPATPLPPADSAPPVLPRRRNRRAGEPEPAPAPEPARDPVREPAVGADAGRDPRFRDPDEAAARMGALQRGTARGRAAGPGATVSDERRR
jgi:signal transduction histidine kinase